MRGILSSAPAPAAVRVLLGGHLLLLVAACLVLDGARAIDGVVAAMMLGCLIGGVAVLIAAILGEPAEIAAASDQKERRHG